MLPKPDVSFYVLGHMIEVAHECKVKMVLTLNPNILVV